MADFDWNGSVDFSDFLTLSDNFGKSSAVAAVAAVAAVPEPNGSTSIAIFDSRYGRLSIAGSILSGD